MVALVGLAEDLEVARLRAVAEQVHEVERGLVGGLGAVLLVVGDVEQTAERGAVTARDVRLDPVVDRHPVEGEPRLREGVPERRIARRLHLALQRVVHGLEVLRRLVVRVPPAEEPVRLRASVRLGAEEVDGGKGEPLRELQDGLVVRVDQLAAQLRLLPVRPEAVAELLPVGVHPPAHTARRLIHIGGEPLVLQGQRRRQPGDAAADDGDPWRGRRPRRPGKRQRPRHRRGRPGYTGTFEELPPRHPRKLAALPQLLNPDPQLRRSPVLPRKTLQSPHQRRPCHRSSARRDSATISHPGQRTQENDRNAQPPAPTVARPLTHARRTG